MAEDWIRDPESARRIRELTESRSTAAKHSTEPPALVFSYYEYNERERLTCPRCGWTGQAGEAGSEHHRELFDVSCPSCDKMLLVVSYPTIEETKRAAGKGNETALRNLPEAEKVEARLERAAKLELKVDSDLPEITGSDLAFEWDFERVDEESWTLIRHGDAVIWRELAYWEGCDRFHEVEDILRQHYGGRFASLEPTRASLLYLHGDH